MLSANRIIYIDFIPKGLVENQIIQVLNSKEVSNLYERYFNLTAHPDLVLNSRRCYLFIYNQLLKFLEDYKGGVTLLATDPVPLPVLSRFIEVKKDFTHNKSHFFNVRLRAASPALRPKLEQLFGINYECD